MGKVNKSINGPFSCLCLLRPELEKRTLMEGRRVKCFGCRRRLEASRKGKRMRCFVGEMTVRVMGYLLGSAYIGKMRLHLNWYVAIVQSIKAIYLL